MTIDLFSPRLTGEAVPASGALPPPGRTGEAAVVMPDRPSARHQHGARRAADRKAAFLQHGEGTPSPAVLRRRPASFLEFISLLPLRETSPDLMRRTAPYVCRLPGTKIVGLVGWAVGTVSATERERSGQPAAPSAGRPR